MESITKGHALNYIRMIEAKSKTLILDFEIDCLKTNEKIEDLEKNCAVQLKHIENFVNASLYGFNWNAALFALCLVHTSRIYYCKQVLHEFERRAIPHLATCLATSIAVGWGFGKVFGKDLKSLLFAQKTIHSTNEKLKEVRRRYFI